MNPVNKNSDATDDENKENHIHGSYLPHNMEISSQSDGLYKKSDSGMCPAPLFPSSSIPSVPPAGSSHSVTDLIMDKNMDKPFFLMTNHILNTTQRHEPMGSESAESVWKGKNSVLSSLHSYSADYSAASSHSNLSAKVMSARPPIIGQSVKSNPSISSSSGFYFASEDIRDALSYKVERLLAKTVTLDPNIHQQSYQDVSPIQSPSSTRVLQNIVHFPTIASSNALKTVQPLHMAEIPKVTKTFDHLESEEFVPEELDTCTQVSLSNKNSPVALQENVFFSKTWKKEDNSSSVITSPITQENILANKLSTSHLQSKSNYDELPHNAAAIAEMYLPAAKNQNAESHVTLRKYSAQALQPCNPMLNLLEDDFDHSTNSSRNDSQFSPTSVSSVASSKPLEWDNGADIGYISTIRDDPEGFSLRSKKSIFANSNPLLINSVVNFNKSMKNDKISQDIATTSTYLRPIELEKQLVHIGSEYTSSDSDWSMNTGKSSVVSSCKETSVSSFSQTNVSNMQSEMSSSRSVSGISRSHSSSFDSISSWETVKLNSASSVDSCQNLLFNDSKAVTVMANSKYENSDDSYLSPSSHTNKYLRLRPVDSLDMLHGNKCTFANEPYCIVSPSYQHLKHNVNTNSQNVCELVSDESNIQHKNASPFVILDSEKQVIEDSKQPIPSNTLVFVEGGSFEHLFSNSQGEAPHIRWYPVNGNADMQDIKDAATQTSLSYLVQQSTNSNFNKESSELSKYYSNVSISDENDVEDTNTSSVGISLLNFVPESFDAVCQTVNTTAALKKLPAEEKSKFNNYIESSTFPSGSYHTANLFMVTDTSMSDANDSFSNDSTSANDALSKHHMEAQYLHVTPEDESLESSDFLVEPFDSYVHALTKTNLFATENMGTVDASSNYKHTEKDYNLISSEFPVVRSDDQVLQKKEKAIACTPDLQCIKKKPAYYTDKQGANSNDCVKMQLKKKTSSPDEQSTSIIQPHANKNAVHHVGSGVKPTTTVKSTDTVVSESEVTKTSENAAFDPFKQLERKFNLLERKVKQKLFELKKTVQRQVQSADDEEMKFKQVSTYRKNLDADKNDDSHKTDVDNDTYSKDLQKIQEIIERQLCYHRKRIQREDERIHALREIISNHDAHHENFAMSPECTSKSECRFSSSSSHFTELHFVRTESSQSSENGLSTEGKTQQDEYFATCGPINSLVDAHMDAATDNGRQAVADKAAGSIETKTSTQNYVYVREIHCCSEEKCVNLPSTSDTSSTAQNSSSLSQPKTVVASDIILQQEKTLDKKPISWDIPHQGFPNEATDFLSLQDAFKFRCQHVKQKLDKRKDVLSELEKTRLQLKAVEFAGGSYQQKQKITMKQDVLSYSKSKSTFYTAAVNERKKCFRKLHQLSRKKYHFPPENQRQDKREQIYNTYRLRRRIFSEKLKNCVINGHVSWHHTKTVVPSVCV